MIVCAILGNQGTCHNSELYDTIDEILKKDTKFIFYTCSDSGFEIECERAIMAAKHRYPESDIRLVPVLPFSLRQMVCSSDCDEFRTPRRIYDSICDWMSNSRYRWMVKQADYVLSYVFLNRGKVYKATKYARRKGKTVFNFYK